MDNCVSRLLDDLGSDRGMYAAEATKHITEVYNRTLMAIFSMEGGRLVKRHTSAPSSISIVAQYVENEHLLSFGNAFTESLHTLGLS